MTRGCRSRTISVCGDRCRMTMPHGREGAGRRGPEGPEPGLTASGVTHLRKAEWVFYAKKPFADRRPCSPALAPSRYLCPPSRRKRRRATRRRRANCRNHRQNDCPNHFNPNSSSQPPRPNPHSTRGTAVTCSTAISCLGAFRTPPASARDSPINTGVRKPGHKPAHASQQITKEYRKKSSRLFIQSRNCRLRAVSYM